MKTIGYILGQFPVLSQTFVGNELRAMQERGHKVVPIVLKRATGPAQPKDLLTAVNATFLENVSTKRALEEFKRPSIGAVRSMSYLLNQQTLSRYSLLGNALKIAAIAREQGCDHLHAHFAGGAASHAIVAARWMGATVSFTGHGTDVNRDREDLELKLQKADLSIGVCNDMVDDFAMTGPASQLAMVPCGTNIEQFRPAETLKSNGKLLYIGRLSPSKGVDDLIEAAYRLGEALNLPTGSHARGHFTKALFYHLKKQLMVKKIRALLLLKKQWQWVCLFFQPASWALKIRLAKIQGFSLNQATFVNFQRR